ncbi:MAG: hypothetical protein JW909_11485 [Planctomycetes bacterium]|nr:hypothetical protein [Planctomycetota bacterium]
MNAILYPAMLAAAVLSGCAGSSTTAARYPGVDSLERRGMPTGGAGLPPGESPPVTAGDDGPSAPDMFFMEKYDDGR